MRRFAQIVTLFMVAVLSAHAVPAVLNYAGQVAVNGQPFDGQGLFKFALVNADGNATYWSNDGTSANGSEPAAHVSISVNGGLYALLLGNTAMAGMGGIDPQVFAQNGDAMLRVWFSDGVNGFQQLSPDRPFASVPYAFSAGAATIADGSINKSMLGSDVIADLNKTITITRDMLPQDVRDDLNATIGINRLSAEVTEKLDRNTTTTNYNAPSVGSLLTVPYGQPAPTGYSLYQRGTPKELVWEEKAPVSTARESRDGAAVLDGKIYFVGGKDGSAKTDMVERYDSNTNSWQTLRPISSAREAPAVSSLQGKLYAIGGSDDNGRSATVEIFDPTNDSWTQGPSLPHVVYAGSSIRHGESIYLIGGNDADYKIANNYMLEANSSAWVAKAPMSIARASQRLVIYEDRIWAMGGNDADSGENALNLVESYDPVSDSWRTEPSLPEKKHWASAWVANGKIYIAGGKSTPNVYEHSIFSFSRETGWISAGNLTENKFQADAVVLNDQVYVIAGLTAQDVYSNKVYTADLNASIVGVYDLYRKDGNASAGSSILQAEVADGSVTASKMADGAVTANKMANNTITTTQLNEQILKYLKPEITAQPQAQFVYVDSNFSYSVFAEGKYLTYQWKKDGADLAGETNATFTITDANATLHDGNYSVVVSNDFGSVESGIVEMLVSDSLLNGLVGWWKFDETNGTVAYDSSGNGNDGNLTNGPTWTTGKIGGALSFDGVDDFVDVREFQWGGEISITSWVKYKAFQKHSRIIDFGNGQDSNNVIFANHSTSSGIYFQTIGNTSSPRLDVPDFWLLNDWIHFVATIDENGVMKAYKDAVLSGSKIDGLKPNSILRTKQYIGKSNWSADSYFNGLIDDLRIYDRALSAAEVQALYNLGQ